MSKSEDAVTVEPPETADASVIWLHGLGADGHDFEAIVPHLGDQVRRHVRFIFPHAPEIPVTINNGYVMRAWYDVLNMDIARRADANGVRASEQILTGYIEAEQARGIASNRIIVAGFSQGGALALHTGLRYTLPLAGILALSCYLPLAETTADEAHAANASVPLFMAHGNHDPIIPIAAGEQARDLVESLGYAVEWHSYPVEHAVCLEEIEDVASWLSRLLD
ncbi:MAG: carboxylesterase [Ketobacter sp.]|nr:carboxylesterase [Ketobacter sp.]